MKRFIPELTDKKIEFLGDDKTIRSIFISYDQFPRVEVEYYEKKPDEVEKTTISCADFVEIMSIKARGKRISFKNIVEIKPLDPLPEEEEEREKGRNGERENEVEEPLETQEPLVPNEPLVAEQKPLVPKEPLVAVVPKTSVEDEEWEQLTLF
jgi:hypothetical protein